MQTSNSTQFKIPHFLLPLLFTIITIFIIFNSTPLTLTVHANGTPGANITDQDGQFGTTTKSNLLYGVSMDQQFWLLYIVDKTGYVTTDVVLISGKEIDTKYTMLSIRPEYRGDGEEGDSIYPSRHYILQPGFGWAFANGRIARGNEVKAWMTSDDPAKPGKPRVITVIEQLWGEKTAELFISENRYLCLEAGMWCGYYINGEYSGKMLAATSYNWAQYNKYQSHREMDFTVDESLEYTGDPYISAYTNDVLPHSIMIEFDQTGVKAPTVTPGKLSCEEIMSYGYGLGIIWAEDLGLNDSTHTWDSTNHPTDEAPAPAYTPDPDKSNTLTTDQLQYTIIKSYRLKDSQGKLTDKGTYIREQVPAKIEIEDEPLGDGRNYKVIGWKHSSTKKSDISSLTWESSVPQSIGETGTTSGSTTLDTSHKYLYVLLEAETGEDKDEALDANYILSQSSITRRINYSAPDSQQTNMTTKLNEYKFIFNLPAHSPTSCKGHTWTHDDNDSNCDNHHTERESGEHDCTQYAITGTHASDCGIYDEEEWEVCDSHTYTNLTF